MGAQPAGGCAGWYGCDHRLPHGGLSTGNKLLGISRGDAVAVEETRNGNDGEQLPRAHETHCAQPASGGLRKLPLRLEELLGGNRGIHQALR